MSHRSPASDAPSPIVLNEVIPWGRTLEEYRRMFSLSDDDLNRRLLGCGDGPASFNAEMAAQNKRVTSIDPVYQFSGDEIRRRFDEVYPQMVEAARDNAGKFNWDAIQSPDQMGQQRRNALERFLADYDQGKREMRYLNTTLPDLPFQDNEFDLALCSHLLFTYSHLLDASFHLKAAREMVRVAREVRIFPLVTLNGRPSHHLNSLLSELKQAGIQPEIIEVNYEFQIGGDQMLRLWSAESS